MSVDNMLQTSLAGLGLPVYPHVYTGNQLSYLVTNYNVIPAVFADRAPHAARYLIQIHYFLPHKQSSLDMIDSICRSIFGAGCTWPSVTDASDGDGQHYVLECEYADAGGFYRGNSGN